MRAGNALHQPTSPVDAFGAVYVTYEEDDRRIGLSDPPTVG